MVLAVGSSSSDACSLALSSPSMQRQPTVVNRSLVQSLVQIKLKAADLQAFGDIAGRRQARDRRRGATGGKVREGFSSVNLRNHILLFNILDVLIPAAYVVCPQALLWQRSGS